MRTTSGAVLLALLFLPGTLQAGYVFQKRVVPHELERQLRKAGFNTAGIACAGERCEIAWGPGGEKKDPKPAIDAYVYEDPAARRREENDRARELLGRLETQAASPFEKTLLELLKLLVPRIIGD